MSLDKIFFSLTISSDSIYRPATDFLVLFKDVLSGLDFSYDTVLLVLRRQNTFFQKGS